MITQAHERPEATKLLSAYVALCNRVIAENRDRFWYRMAVQLSRRLFDRASFRTLVYDRDPWNVIEEHTLHYDADRQRLTLLPAGGATSSFAWKIPLDYLVDVVETRPGWYREHPTMLDWKWATERLADEAAPRAHAWRVVALGGLAVVVLALAGGLYAARRAL
jgi:hypothetical protein